MSLTLFCPAQIGLKSLKKKWTIEILYGLHHKPSTYQGLKQSLVDISDKVLSQRLRELQEIDLVEKIESSPQVYALTSRGITINQVLYELSLLGLAILDKDSFNSQDLRMKIADFFSIPENDINQPPVIR